MMLALEVYGLSVRGAGLALCDVKAQTAEHAKSLRFFKPKLHMPCRCRRDFQRANSEGRKP
jgi:hypothetical protein